MIEGDLHVDSELISVVKIPDGLGDVGGNDYQTVILLGHSL